MGWFIELLIQFSSKSGFGRDTELLLVIRRNLRKIRYSLYRSIQNSDGAAISAGGHYTVTKNVLTSYSSTTFSDMCNRQPPPPPPLDTFLCRQRAKAGAARAGGDVYGRLGRRGQRRERLRLPGWQMSPHVGLPVLGRQTTGGGEGEQCPRKQTASHVHNSAGRPIAVHSKQICEETAV